jgi:hypothetical protein
MAYGFGRTVRLVNRVIDENGKRVPIEFMVGGEAIWLRDNLDVPVGVARIMIHQSMYKIDPVSGLPSYKLGCESLGCEETDLPVSETKRLELVDRDLMPESSRGKMKVEKLHNPINPALSRRSQSGPRAGDDGAFPGEFGWQEN